MVTPVPKFKFTPKPQVTTKLPYPDSQENESEEKLPKFRFNGREFVKDIKDTVKAQKQDKMDIDQDQTPGEKPSKTPGFE